MKIKHLPLLIFLLLSFPLHANNWKDLDKETQGILAPFQSEWNNMSEQKQQKLITGASRWIEMDETQRQQAQSMHGKVASVGFSDLVASGICCMGWLTWDIDRDDEGSVVGENQVFSDRDSEGEMT